MHEIERGGVPQKDFIRKLEKVEREEKKRKIFANTKNEPYWPKTQFVRKDKNGIQQIKRLKD